MCDGAGLVVRGFISIFRLIAEFGPSASFRSERLGWCLVLRGKACTHDTRYTATLRGKLSQRMAVPEVLYHASCLNYCMICRHWEFLRAPEGGETVANPRFDLMMIPKFNYHCVSYGIEAGAPGFG